MNLLAPVYLAAILFFDFQAYRYGFAVATLCGVNEFGAAVLGVMCVCIANLIAAGLTLVTLKLGARR